MQKIQRVRPFLKWAGNKYRLLDRILNLLPAGNRLIEPFAGSAAVFLNTHYSRYLISDSNQDLINLYQYLNREEDSFIHYCNRFFQKKFNDTNAYYDFREEFNTTNNIRRKSALFLYLNRHGYNGLCRYNSKGGFNVPFGRYKKPYFPLFEMQYFAAKAKRAVIKQQDFKQVIESAKPGDIVYCDPPYVPISDSANFTHYSAAGFNLEQQKVLAVVAELAAERGIPVLISNHQTDFINKTYQTACDIHAFPVQRYISCKGNNRQTANEVLALFS